MHEVAHEKSYPRPWRLSQIADWVSQYGAFGRESVSCKLTPAVPGWGVSENRLVGEIARTKDQPGPPMWDNGVLEATADRLVELAVGGAAQEFAVGTGRLAILIVGHPYWR